MSVISDMNAATQRFKSYIERYRQLLLDYGVTGASWYANLKNANHDANFKAKRDVIWKQLLEQEGGKLGFGAVLGIVGAVLGGVGIAAGGGAIGIPLALLLVPAGLLIGNEFDCHHVGAKLMRWIRR
jgi:hypothetical protein